MSAARLELLVEPFKENDPGPHVTAVIDAAIAAGLDVDMGPFATVVEADLQAIIAATPALLAAGFAAGATAVQFRLEHGDGP